MPQNPLITKEERALFKAAVEHVKPLSSDSSAPLPQQPYQQPKRSPRTNDRIYQDDDLNLLLRKQPCAFVPPVSSEEALTFARSGLQTRVLQRLKRGEFVTEAVLDLHGLNLIEAEQILQCFLTQALEEQWRCVQIIHGKGVRIDQAPVLKNAINQWLRAYSVVLAFCSSKARDGGAGAVYVLLKS